MQHLSKYNILSDGQFGFRLKHSCESQLLVTVNDIARAINNNMQVDAAILDFSKAFDKVAHKHLIYKLNYYGIRGNLLNWLTSFLNQARAWFLEIDPVRERLYVCLRVCVSAPEAINN